MELTHKERSEMKKHMSKVLSGKEKPFDGLRARTIVLLTHRTDGAEVFLKMTQSQPLRMNRYTAWKYCNLMHTALRHGTPQILELMQQPPQQQLLYALSNYWAYHTDALCACILEYLQLLLHKISFHQNYAFFTGALEADITKEWDLDLCYQLCTDIFDYLDHLLTLQKAIFSSLTLQQLAVATPETLCRLQPLINIAAECSILYDQASNAMANVCGKLPPIDVMGLCNRFYALYQRLRGFYSSLQQAKIILKMESVPELSTTVPDFLAFSNSSACGRQPTAPPVWQVE
nr:huntingtin-interacting protein 1 [Bactrocera oleae]